MTYYGHPLERKYFLKKKWDRGRRIQFNATTLLFVPFERYMVYQRSEKDHLVLARIFIFLSLCRFVASILFSSCSWICILDLSHDALRYFPSISTAKIAKTEDCGSPIQWKTDFFGTHARFYHCFSLFHQTVVQSVVWRPICVIKRVLQETWCLTTVGAWRSVVSLFVVLWHEIDSCFSLFPSNWW